MAKKKPKKKLTQNQQIYKQEVAKLKRIISLNLGKNYDVNYEEILKITNNLVMPQRVTKKKIQQLKDLRNPKNFHQKYTNKYDTSKQFNHEIPEGFTPKQDFKIRIDNSDIAPFELSEWLLDELSRIPPLRVFYAGYGVKSGELNTEKIQNDFYNLYISTQDTYRKYGKESNYLKYLAKKQDEIVDCIETICYTNYQDTCHDACLELAQLIKGAPLTFSEANQFSDLSEGLIDSVSAGDE